jgi:DNA-binding MarR family transcriptional regulator
MESGLIPEQTRAVQDFMLFLGEHMGQTNYQFEHAMHCSPEEVSVLYILAARSPLMVKEVARGLQGVSMSKLTRLLDQLEEQGYISRSLNLVDRRSFHVSLTEQGKVLCERLEQQMTALAENIIRALTPIERLLLVELFAKIRANWSTDSVE